MANPLHTSGFSPWAALSFLLRGPINSSCVVLCRLSAVCAQLSEPGSSWDLSPLLALSNTIILFCPNSSDLRSTTSLLLSVLFACLTITWRLNLVSIIPLWVDAKSHCLFMRGALGDHLTHFFLFFSLSLLCNPSKPWTHYEAKDSASVPAASVSPVAWYQGCVCMAPCPPSREHPSSQ